MIRGRGGRHWLFVTTSIYSGNQCCKETEVKLKRCSACHIVAYCSEVRFINAFFCKF